MNKILSFDSVYLINPIRKVYVAVIERILNSKDTSLDSLVLYRLDQDNVLIRNKRNISGTAIGIHKDQLDAMSIKFYNHLEDSGTCKDLLMKDLKLYKLYTRQVKLKLTGVLKCALRIRSLSLESQKNIEIITDRQTESILNEAFLFLHYEPKNITWNINSLLTTLITTNSLIMRIVAVVKMLITPSNLPKHYFYNHIDSNLPTVMITMPKRRTDDFFSSYVEEFSNQFNTILYSMGSWHNKPLSYKRIKIKSKIGILRGLFNVKNLCFNADSYIADILLIFYDHSNLNRSIDVVRSIFSNKIDAHVSRLQTNVVDNYLALEARERGVFILGDIMEEIFYCDSAIFSSESENTEPSRLALTRNSKVSYRGSNSLIKYRLKNFTEKQPHYLQKLLQVNKQKKIIFYASDPSKDESQRYHTEKFLIDSFSTITDFVLAIKTHPQDNGKITNYAYLDSSKPSNVILIGDITQKNRIVSNKFFIFEDFNFNAAVRSSDGFLTFSSSSILQALMLGVKTGVVDKFSNGNYDYLINHKASMLVNSEDSLQNFLNSDRFEIPEEILSYCGLKDENDTLDIGEYLVSCMNEFDQTYKKIFKD